MYLLAMNTSTQQQTIIVITHRLTTEGRYHEKSFHQRHRHCQESNLGYENIRQNLK